MDLLLYTWINRNGLKKIASINYLNFTAATTNFKSDQKISSIQRGLESWVQKYRYVIICLKLIVFTDLFREPFSC